MKENIWKVCICSEVENEGEMFFGSSFMYFTLHVCIYDLVYLYCTDTNGKTAEDFCILQHSNK